MLTFSLDLLSWISDATGAVIGEASTAVLNGIMSWVEDGLRSVTSATAMELAELDVGSQTAQ